MSTISKSVAISGIGHFSFILSVCTFIQAIGDSLSSIFLDHLHFLRSPVTPSRPPDLPSVSSATHNPALAMKLSYVVTGFVASRALAHPSMDRVLVEIQARDDYLLETRSTTLLGDLAGLAASALTSSGDAIKGILQGGSTAVAGTSTYPSTPALGSDACKKDTCCVWKYVVDEMKTSFQDSDGCTDLARGAIRQGFHDAATWDKDSTYGGADGSLLLSDELSRRDNLGLQEIGAKTMTWYNKYKQYGAGMADMIQVGALTAVVSCPGGPRIRNFVGRKDNSQAGPTGKLPNPFQSAQSLIDMFTAKTFTANDLVALIGAHTASKQKFVDTSRSGTPQDSTPGKWDTKYYSETLSSDNSTILVFPSDRNLATYSATKDKWNTFAGSGGQQAWRPVGLYLSSHTLEFATNKFVSLGICISVFSDEPTRGE